MSQEEDVAVLKVEMSAMKEQHKIMATKLDEVHNALTKYKGFIGGVVFLWSCVVAMFGAWWTYFKH